MDNLKRTNNQSQSQRLALAPKYSNDAIFSTEYITDEVIGSDVSYSWICQRAHWHLTFNTVAQLKSIETLKLTTFFLYHVAMRILRAHRIMLQTYSVVPWLYVWESLGNSCNVISDTIVTSFMYGFGRWDRLICSYRLTSTWIV